MVVSFFMPQSLQTHISAFLQYLQFQKRYSRHTIISYQTDLRDFADYMAGQYAIHHANEISAPMIRSWQAHLKSADGNTARTINRKISTLKSFYKFLLRQDIVAQSPMGLISNPKMARRLPPFVDKSDMELLFSHVEFPQDWQGKTERLILQIFYHAGIRQAELIQLQNHHFDRHNSTIKVLGKGSKERVIPIGQELSHAIIEYLSDKAAEFNNPGNTFLLVNKKGNKLYARQVYDIVKKYLALVTTIEKKSPHILRHSFATHLTNNGADINAIKELLGHSSLAATQVYTHNSIEKLLETFKKAHPKA